MLIAIENIKEHNPNWPKGPAHTYRALITRGSGSGKTNPIVYLTSPEVDINKIYFYIKDLDKAKYQLLINKRENLGLKHFNDCKPFYSIVKWYGRCL